MGSIGRVRKKRPITQPLGVCVEKMIIWEFSDRNDQAMGSIVKIEVYMEIWGNLQHPNDNELQRNLKCASL